MNNQVTYVRLLSNEEIHHTNLSTGVRNSPDILQQKMNDLFQGLEFIHVSIEKRFIMEKSDWIDHI